GPRLDGGRVVAVEVAHARLEPVVALPGGWHEHRERVADVAAAADEQLEGVVEQGRVRAGLVERRGEAVALDPELPGPGAHRGHVAGDRVDLAGVAQEAGGLRALPGGGGGGRGGRVEDAGGGGPRRGGRA